MLGSIDPIVLFFLLGLGAGVLKADLRLPPAIYEFVSTLLLLSIGMKGGVELSRQPVTGLAVDIGLTLLLGVALTLVAFAVLRGAGRLSRVDSAAVAAHYGSVSVGTFAVGVAYLAREGIPAEPVMPLLLVLLEVPAIVLGILLARGVSASTQWGEVMREVLLGRSVLLLLGGLLIGWLAGPVGLEPVAPLFFDLFKGMLAIFLLEMGLIAAEHLGGFRRHGVFMVLFAISASYIAAPAAMRTAVPEANPALSLTAALAVTFPFNILVGIPLYRQAAQILLPH